MIYVNLTLRLLFFQRLGSEYLEDADNLKRSSSHKKKSSEWTILNVISESLTMKGIYLRLFPASQE